MKKNLNTLNALSLITEYGVFVGNIDNEIIQENPTVCPIHFSTLLPNAKYKGCGEWTNYLGEEFTVYDIRPMLGKDGYNVKTNLGNIKLLTVGNKTDKKLRCTCESDLMNDDAVLTITQDGWKIIDMFAFEDIPWEMVGYHTYAFRDGIIKKCIIGYEDGEIKYTLY